MNPIVVGYDTADKRSQAEELGQRLGLMVNNQAYPRLHVTKDKLVLIDKRFSPLFVDFNDVKWQKRLEAGKKQGLVRACKPGKGVMIVDATAGWGRDAAVLASFGSKVVMLERHPIMAELLQDALQRLDPKSSLAHRLSIVNSDSKIYLQELNKGTLPDVIYIDPMHPLRQKSALVKKDMQVLQELLGADDDAEVLIRVAIGCARQRVVVKWPQRLPPLVPPDLSIPGKTVRFDIYRSKK